ncbi:MAG: GAF domain-containing protein, partial [Candidatus Methanoperedens sp.]|nr:GAF domain-containing protein [Candidatus Methanoperedens sp.]
MSMEVPAKKQWVAKMKQDYPFPLSHRSLIFITLLVFFLAEIAVMVLLLNEETRHAILDASLLTILAAPFLAFLITKHIQAQNALQKAHRILSVLYTIDRKASQSLNLNEILNAALDATLNALQIEAGGIFLLEPDGETMTLRTHRGFSEEFVNNIRQIKLDEGVFGKAAADKKPVVLDVSEYPTERLTPFIAREGLKTLASTPIIAGGKVIGALNLGTRCSYAFSPEEIELLASVGQQLGMVMQNARLYENVLESEEKFRRLCDNTPNMVFINKKGRVYYANKICEEIMGYKIEEFYHPDFDFLTLFAPEYIDMVKKNFKRHLQGKEIPPYESTMITKAG